jgi:filamentous hemagglutinin
MSTQVQYRRGSNAQNAAFTGALAEITVDTTNGTLRVHDGITAGGSNIATVSYVTAQISALSANSITNGTSSVAVIASGGNIRSNVAGATVQTISAGLVAITGDLSVSGNATLSGNIIGDRIVNGTTNIEVQTPSGNANITVGGVSNVALFTTTGLNITGIVSATGNITGGNILGGANVNATTHTGATVSVTGNIDGGNLRTGGLISATGNITGGNILGGANVNATTHTGATVSVTGAITAGGDLSLVGNIVDTGPLTVITSSNGNITLAPNGTGVVIVNTDIRNGQASGTGNIGAAGATFNTIFARSTSAQYADLAEMYESDIAYSPGTVVEFGGTKEVTATTDSHSTAVAGIISTNPSYLMNSAQAGDHVLAVALVGRVPCRVVGTIKRGDRLVSSSTAGAATVLSAEKYQPGCIVAKALEDYDSETVGIIEVAVGRT